MPGWFELVMLFLMGILGVTRVERSPAEALSSADSALAEAPAAAEGPSAYEERIVLPSSPQGLDRHEIRGRPCTEGTTRGFTAAMMSGSGLCMVEGWASDDPHDCRVRVYLRQSPLHSGVCVVTVYENPM